MCREEGMAVALKTILLSREAQRVVCIVTTDHTIRYDWDNERLFKSP